jgi:2-oxoglutarate ferredoxin oxidoreductase subunit gamma
MDYAEIRLSGSGGQGMGLAGRIFSESAIAEGYNVCQTQSYGPEARGGASRTDIIVSRKKILFPNCRNLDVLLAMNQESSDKFSCSVREDGMVLVDSTYVDQPPEANRVYEYELTKTSLNTFKIPLAANLIALGMIAALTRYFSLESWTDSIRRTVPEKYRDLNLDAFELGHREGREILHVEEGRLPVAYDRKRPVPECIKERFDGRTSAGSGKNGGAAKGKGGKGSKKKTTKKKGGGKKK